MSWQPTPAAPQPGTTTARPGRILIWVGSVTFLIALVVGIVAVVNIVGSVGRPLVDAMQNPAYETPADFAMTLEAKQYTIYASEIGARPSVGAEDVTVTGPDGAELTIDDADNTVERIARGSTDYLGAARFTAATAGEYQIRVEEQPDAMVVVAPSIAPSFEEVGYSVLAALAALTVGLIGLIMFIVGLVRLSSARKQAAYLGQGYPGQGYQGPPGQGQPGQGYPQQGQPQQGYAPQNYGQTEPLPKDPLPNPPEQQPNQPPAGWYPDPGTPGRSRYWDGGTWTEHQR